MGSGFNPILWLICFGFLAIAGVIASIVGTVAFSAARPLAKKFKQSQQLPPQTIEVGIGITVGLITLVITFFGLWEMSAGSFIYWTTAKVLIWLLPAGWLIRLSGRNLKQIFNITNYKGWLLWGGGIGLTIALTEFIPNYLNGNPLLPTELSYVLVNILIIAPTFEEFLIRGAILGNLRQHYTFLSANIITSFMFVILHLPGWFFAGNLVDNFTKPIGGVVSIFLISLLFGYAVKRSNSVIGGMLAHFLNNLA